MLTCEVLCCFLSKIPMSARSSSIPRDAKVAAMDLGLFVARAFLAREVVHIFKCCAAYFDTKVQPLLTCSLLDLGKVHYIFEHVLVTCRSCQMRFFAFHLQDIHSYSHLCLVEKFNTGLKIYQFCYLSALFCSRVLLPIQISSQARASDLPNPMLLRRILSL
jgi:hypothetical protein